MSDEASLVPDGLTTILFGHAAFQCLNAGCELGLFELLNRKPDLIREEIADVLGLGPRAVDILLLGNSSLRLIARSDAGRFRNGPRISRLFDEGHWESFRDVVAFEAHIVYEGQADFVESLRKNSNVGLRRIPGSGNDLYRRLAQNPDLERVFYRYMRSWSDVVNPVIVEKVDFTQVRHVLDVGGGDAVNAIALARAFPHLKVTVLELVSTAPIARKRVRENGLEDRITVVVGDMFTDPYPPGHDCVLFAHQLVIWTPEENVALLRRAYDALSPGGKVVIVNSMSEDTGDGPLMAALDSVYFAALPAEGGMIYAWRQYEEWLAAAGFAGCERLPCQTWTPHGIIVAIK